MRTSRKITFAIALPLLAAATLARAEDPPGYFKVPGTDTTVKFYGYGVIDGAFDMQPALGDFGTIVNAITNPAAPGNTDGYAAKDQWTMTANRSRLGFTSTTPSSLGEVTAKVEGDFLGGTLRLRHGYGTIGPVLAGKTWSTFLDLDALPETVDFTGGIGSSNFDTPRMTQVRVTVPIDPKVALALAVEQDETGSTDARFPGGLVGAFTFSPDWGHVAARVLLQQYGTFVARSGNTPAIKYNNTAVAWQLSGHFRISKDSLQWAVVSGDGLGAYGAGFQALEVASPAPDRTNHFWHSTGYTLGYAHVWTPTVRSNLVLSELTFDRDGTFTHDADFQKVANAFVNTFVTLAKNCELGLEYAYGQATTFGKAMVREDGSATDQLKESRLQMALQFNFF